MPTSAACNGRGRSSCQRLVAASSSCPKTSSRPSGRTSWSSTMSLGRSFRRSAVAIPSGCSRTEGVASRGWTTLPGDRRVVKQGCVRCACMTWGTRTRAACAPPASRPRIAPPCSGTPRNRWSATTPAADVGRLLREANLVLNRQETRTVLRVSNGSETERPLEDARSHSGPTVTTSTWSCSPSAWFLARLAGFEPTTPWFVDNQTRLSDWFHWHFRQVACPSPPLSRTVLLRRVPSRSLQPGTGANACARVVGGRCEPRRRGRSSLYTSHSLVQVEGQDPTQGRRSPLRIRGTKADGEILGTTATHCLFLCGVTVGGSGEFRPQESCLSIRTPVLALTAEARHEAQARGRNHRARSLCSGWLLRPTEQVPSESSRL